MDRLDLIEDLALAMEDICVTGGMERFDRVRLVRDPGKPPEVWFLWEERKLVVAVELTSGPEALAEALARAEAGDPAFN